MSPEVREQSTRLFLVRLLQQSFYDAKRHLHVPHIIFLDNGQWLDEESWRLAATVTNLVRPLLLIVASRPLRQDALGRPPCAACTELLKEDNLERSRVDLMSSDDMTRLHGLSSTGANWTLSASVPTMVAPSIPQSSVVELRSQAL
jgi:hypothetical protein